MKIEKINENQIRCTLSKEDLEQRNIKLSEFAYGTSKARSLFKEMMRWASYKFGFEAEDIPLVIEAVPVSPDSIILIVTKIPYPDELDTRFSSFSDLSDIAAEDMDDDYEEYDDVSLEDFTSPGAGIDYRHTANDILKLFSGKSEKTPSGKEEKVLDNVVRIFAFSTLDDLIDAIAVIGANFAGGSTLTKLDTGEYCLILSMDDSSPSVFNHICNVFSEYSKPLPETLGLDSHIAEMTETIIESDAIRVLADL